MFLKNKNIIFKIRRSKVTDYAALIIHVLVPVCQRQLVQISICLAHVRVGKRRGGNLILFYMYLRTDQVKPGHLNCFCLVVSPFF